MSSISVPDPLLQGPPVWRSVVEWAANTAYFKPPWGSVVYYDGSLYECRLDHTSGTSFAADLSSGRWQIAVSAQLTAEWQEVVNATVDAANQANQAAQASVATSTENAEATAEDRVQTGLDRAAAEAARDVALGTIRDFAGIADIAIATIPLTIEFIRTSGYSGPGGGNGCLWKRVGSQPASTELWVQSADGAYWLAIMSLPTLNAFGATGTGSTPTDDQAAFAKALAFVRSTRTTAGFGFGLQEYESGTMIEPGRYDFGDLINNQQGSIRLTARIPGTVVVRIPDDTYCWTQGANVSSIFVDGIAFLGGKGAFNLRNSAENVFGMMQFRNCVFYGYTECAIQNNSSDHPFLRVYHSVFYCKADNTLPLTIGIAWGGLLDQLIVEGCSFSRNHYHVKLGDNAATMSGDWHIDKNDFLSFGTVRTKSCIWLVPRKSTSSVNTGGAGTISNNKFGNENQLAGNPRILVAYEAQADIDAGKPRGQRNPDENWGVYTAGGFVTGVIVSENRVSSISSPGAPFIKSYIPNLIGWTWTANQFDGGLYDYAVQFMGDAGRPYARQDWQIDVGSGNQGVTEPFAYGFSNYYLGPVVDRHGWLQGDFASVSDIHSTRDDLSTTVYLASVSSASWTGLNATKQVWRPYIDPDNPELRPDLKDIYGGTGLMEFTLTASGGYAYCSPSGLANTAALKTIWVQVWLQKGTVDSLSRVSVELWDSTANVIRGRRTVQLTDNLKPVFFQTVAPSGSGTLRVRIAPTGYSDVDPVANRFRVFGAAVNSGPAPIELGHLRRYGGSAWNTPHAILGAYHLWLDAAGHLRVKSSAPTSDTDGAFLPNTLSGTATYNPPSLAAGARDTVQTMTVTGAALGDVVTASFSLSLQGVSLIAYVSAADTVSYFFENRTAGTVDLASGTVKVFVSK